MFENQTLYSKLDNLENVFIGQPLHRDTQRL
jgi:ABC-type phosphate transport system auxiliary subunit